MTEMYNPWIDAGERYGDWIIERVPLHGLHEVMCIKNKVILLEQDRDKWERRCDLAHAIAHIDLGHVSRFDRKSEQAAVRRSVKMLIDLEPLGKALSESDGEVNRRAAWSLGVDLVTLRTRLQILHPAERGYLMRTLAHLREEHAA